jgi:hypothetical protein
MGVVTPKIKYEQVNNFCEYGLYFEVGACFYEYLWLFNYVLTLKYVILFQKEGQLRRMLRNETEVGAGALS